eukprot:6795678-Prymnesium_polylepis.1
MAAPRGGHSVCGVNASPSRFGLLGGCLGVVSCPPLRSDRCVACAGGLYSESSISFPRECRRKVCPCVPLGGVNISATAACHTAR